MIPTNHQRIGSCLACAYRVMNVLREFGERWKSVRVFFLYNYFIKKVQISVLTISYSIYT